MEEQADVGLIGLAVMGQNLAMNMNDHGYIVAAYNRTTQKVDEFMNDAAKGSNIVPCHSVEDFVASLKRPRKIILMVKAGTVVDIFIEQLLRYLEEGDIVIDGGNSLYSDSERRVTELDKKGILYVGAGISGGEEGARLGPSIMPGGKPEAWPHIQNILQDIAAKVGDNNEPCCDWVGKGGAGHYVKMVHNGIEYGDMQLICEAYHIFLSAGFSNDKIQKVFTKWNEGHLSSFLVDIAANILAYKEDGEHLLDKILDTAGQKGTGKWTAIEALDLGTPLTLISESVFARFIAAMKESRVRAAKEIKVDLPKQEMNDEQLIDYVEQALYASKIISYAQGFMLLSLASKQYKWDLNYGNVALLWRGGCIIRSAFLSNIKDAYEKNPELESLLLDSFFKNALLKAQTGWRETLKFAIGNGIPTPCFSSALSFFDSYRSDRLPSNLLQALRDYFGAHTYERIDKPRGEFFHTNWTGQGGNVSSTTYNA